MTPVTRGCKSQVPAPVRSSPTSSLPTRSTRSRLPRPQAALLESMQERKAVDRRHGLSDEESVLRPRHTEPDRSAGRHLPAPRASARPLSIHDQRRIPDRCRGRARSCGKAPSDTQLTVSKILHGDDILQLAAHRAAAKAGGGSARVPVRQAASRSACRGPTRQTRPDFVCQQVADLGRYTAREHEPDPRRQARMPCWRAKAYHVLGGRWQPSPIRSCATG